MAEREPFLARWSRRKSAEAREPQASPPQDAAETLPTDDTAPPALPDAASLTPESDFAAFMAERVDPALRKQALRALWRLDPSLTTPDGLVEYGDDFTGKLQGNGLVRTAWRLGRGMTAPDEPQTTARAEEDGGEGCDGAATASGDSEDAPAAPTDSGKETA